MNFVITLLQNYCEKILKVSCISCRKPIDGSFVSVGEDSFHKSCFVCVNCNISPQFYILKNGSIYCKLCHNKSFGEKCSRCLNVFSEGEEFISVSESKYHDNCFNCRICNTKIPMSGFGFKNNEIYCRRCESQL